MLVAVCTKCGEEFNPHGESEEDLIHLFRGGGHDDGEEECEGQGVIVGEYLFNKRSRRLREKQTPLGKPVCEGSRRRGKPTDLDAQGDIKCPSCGRLLGGIGRMRMTLPYHTSEKPPTERGWTWR